MKPSKEFTTWLYSYKWFKKSTELNVHNYGIYNLIRLFNLIKENKIDLYSVISAIPFISQT